VAASPSTEPTPGERVGLARALLSHGRYERLAALGALTCLASLPLPWYQVRFANRFQKSGLGSFGFAEAALIITVGAALVLLVQVGRGRRPPLPLHEGTLLAAAGTWAAGIVGFLMLDRPSATIIHFPVDYGLSYGIFFALGGAATLALAGLRIRHAELGREQVTRPPEAARSPTSASPPRSPRSPSPPP
jgi:hypothetical protein